MQQCSHKEDDFDHFLFLVQDVTCAEDGFGPDEIQLVNTKVTSQCQEVKETQKTDFKGCYLNHPLSQAAPTTGLDNSSYDGNIEVDGEWECNDEGQKVKLPSQGKKEGTNNDKVAFVYLAHIHLT